MPKRKKKWRADAPENSGARSKKLYSAYLAGDLRSELRIWPKPDRARVGKLIQNVQENFRPTTSAFRRRNSRSLAQRQPAPRLRVSNRSGTPIAFHIGIAVVALLSHHREPRRSPSLPKIVPPIAFVHGRVHNLAIKQSDRYRRLQPYSVVPVITLQNVAFLPVCLLACREKNQTSNY